MEYPDDSVFEEIKNNIKLEAPNSEHTDLPDYIDIREHVIVRNIKQEELLIKSEVEDSCEDNK